MFADLAKIEKGGATHTRNTKRLPRACACTAITEGCLSPTLWRLSARAGKLLLDFVSQLNNGVG